MLTICPSDKLGNDRPSCWPPEEDTEYEEYRLEGSELNHRKWLGDVRRTEDSDDFNNDVGVHMGCLVRRRIDVCSVGGEPEGKRRHQEGENS